VNRSILTAATVATFASLQACGGTSSAGGRGGLPPVESNPPSHRGVHARLLINVPPQKHRRKIRVHGRYISPATASLTYSVSPALAGGATNGEIDINTSNPDCQTTGVVGYLACSLDIDGVVPGTPYTFGFTTWDAPGGSGNELSANDDVPFTAEAGQSNVLQATLGGVAASFALTPMSAQRMTGSSTGYSVYGNGAVKFSVAAIDADDNFIIGPGAPAPAVSPSAGAPMTVASAGPNSPNEWTLTSTFAASDPSIPSNVTLAVSATPVPGSGGSTVNATIPVALYQPWVYVVDTFGVVRAYDENGAVIAGFSTITLPGNAAVAFGNHHLYVWGSDSGADQSANYLAEYPPTGGAALYTATPSTIPAIGVANHPNQIAYDPGNDALYTGDGNDGDILSFNGGLTQNLASINNGSFSDGIDDIGNGQIAAAFNANAVRTCDEGLVACPTLKSGSYNFGMGFDPYTSQLGICTATTGVQLIGLTGVNGIKIASPNCDAVAFDTHNKQWYVAPTSSGGVYVVAFDESGNAVPLTGGFGGLTYYPQSIAIAP
jgi:hypothetical protein